MSNISVRFMFDKEKKRVVFAEAGSDFIDVLFSFLTLPLGAIVRLLGKQTGLGSLDNIYESLEQFNTEDFQAVTCKKMFLNPRTEAAVECKNSKKNVNPKKFYLCNESDCFKNFTCYYTYVSSAECPSCFNMITNSWVWLKNIHNEGGIFVNGRTNFMITDDLQLMPTSLVKGCSLLEKFQIKDPRILEERIIDFGKKELLNLLKRALLSKNPLTEVYLADANVQVGLADVNVQASLKYPLMIKEEIKEEMNDNETKSEITFKLILNKKSKNVLCAQVGEDFVNQLFTFLTFSLGSVFRLLSDNLGGCINNLYSSVENMDIDCFVSTLYRNFLLTPKLPSFYDKKQMLNLQGETKLQKFSALGSCMNCYFKGYNSLFSFCGHGLNQVLYPKLGAKFENVMAFNGSLFGGNSGRFKIEDDLQISLLSFISTINKYETNFVEKDVCIDKTKVMLLLTTMLISKTVLTDVFCPKLMA